MFKYVAVAVTRRSSGADSRLTDPKGSVFQVNPPVCHMESIYECAGKAGRAMRETFSAHTIPGGNAEYSQRRDPFRVAPNWEAARFLGTKPWEA